MSENNLFDLFTGEDEKITKASKISGIVVGIVSSNNDEENLGRDQASQSWPAPPFFRLTDFDVALPVSV